MLVSVDEVKTHLRIDQDEDDVYGDKETYIRRETAFSTYAFVTADGAWHEQGRMGWFGMDDSTNESISRYEKAFQAYLEEARKKGLAMTIVDCHI